ncbi:unnamed protein product, partial [marine sediment metagenome]
YPYETEEEKLSQQLESCQVSCENHKRKSRFNDYKARYWKGRAEKILQRKEAKHV